MTDELLPYTLLLAKLKERIKEKQLRAVLTFNIQLLGLYHEIGEAIYQQELQKGWGAKVVEQLSKDLSAEFPEMRGLSMRNLRYMREFFRAWPELSILQQAAATIDDPQILQQPAAKLPWTHNCLILDKLKTKEERLFYANKAVENGWSRDMLRNQIDGGLYLQIGKLPNNFSRVLPSGQSELMIQLFKDPFRLDFLELAENAKEKDLENALMTHITRFMLELGKGYSFYGRQVLFQHEQNDYYADLIFYNIRYRFFLIIELKIGDFKPRDAGQMNFYLSLADDYLKTPEDHPSIGLILCKNKNNATAEYALRDLQKPIGVAGYELKITKAIPSSLKDQLPSVQELEEEILKDISIPTSAVLEKISGLKQVIADLNKAPMTLIKTKEAVEHILFNVIENLIGKLQVLLRDILPLFNESFICPVINGSYYSKDIRTHYEFELNRQGILNVGIHVHLEGFNRGGTNTFNEIIELVFFLEKHKYLIGPTTPRREFWHERLYQDEWTEELQDELANRFSEKIVDQIQESVQRTKK